MGCDIHIFAESKINKKWIRNKKEIFTLDEWSQTYQKRKKCESPFNWRSYFMFAFFADVRNYYYCRPISEPKGLPEDSEYLNSVSNFSDTINIFTGELIPLEDKRTNFDTISDDYVHSASWLTLKELLEFDYNQTFENRRTTNDSNGTAIAEIGKGEIITYKKNLKNMFFTHLEELKQLGNPEDVRIVFYFDN